MLEQNPSCLAKPPAGMFLLLRKHPSLPVLIPKQLLFLFARHYTAKLLEMVGRKESSKYGGGYYLVERKETDFSLPR